MSSLKLDELPNELLEAILLNLPLQQILLCKQVNKRFCWLIGYYLRLRCLVIANTSGYVPANQRWFHRRTPVDCLHIVRRDFHYLRRELHRSMLSGLKRLFVIRMGPQFVPHSGRSDLFDVINQHRQLEQVQIDDLLGSQMTDDPLTISLPLLKIFSLRQPGGVGNQLGNLVFDTPVLTYLECLVHHVKKLIFRYPNSIRQFSCYENGDYLLHLSQLEELYCRDFRNYISDDFLQRMSCLKMIQFNSDEHAFHKLKLQKVIYRRKQLVLYPLGFHFEILPNFNVDFRSENFDDDYVVTMSDYGRSLTDRSLALYAGNLSRLAPVLPFIEQIRYDDLERLFDNKIPLDFLVKLCNLQAVRVKNQVRHRDQFAKFLRICNNLRDVEFFSPSFDQAFFDNELVKLVPNVERLLLWTDDLDVEGHSVLDYQFILNFESIWLFAVNRRVEQQLLRALFGRFTQIVINFQDADHQVLLNGRRPNGTFEVRTGFETAYYAQLDEALSAIDKYWP